MSNESLAGWLDLTVPDASRARSFYAQVLGVSHSAVAMFDARGDYADFCLHVGAPAVTPPLAGVCHARGGNDKLPPVWIPYFRVEDLTLACTRAFERGATIFDGPRGCGGTVRVAFVRDPDGAVFAVVGS